LIYLNDYYWHQLQIKQKHLSRLGKIGRMQ
jgi:hypothetical protein